MLEDKIKSEQKFLNLKKEQKVKEDKIKYLESQLARITQPESHESKSSTIPQIEDTLIANKKKRRVRASS